MHVEDVEEKLAESMLPGLLAMRYVINECVYCVQKKVRNENPEMKPEDIVFDARDIMGIAEADCTNDVVLETAVNNILNDISECFDFEGVE